MYGYIYKTTNLINGKIYIGQHTSNKFDDTYYGSGYNVKAAIKKYGKNNFKCEVVQECFSYDELNEREKYWINYFNSQDRSVGYNLCEGGVAPRYDGTNHPMYGKHHTVESKHKNSLSHLGKHHSAKTLQKMSNSQKGKKLSEEHKRKLSESHKGKKYHPLTEEGRKRISEASKNRVCTDETREKIRQARIGKKFTDEHKQKLSKSHMGKISYWRGKCRDEETCKKISKTLTGKPNYNGRIKYSVGDRTFNGLGDGAEYFNITKSCMSLWIKRGYTKNKEVIKVLSTKTKRRKV